MTVRVQLLDVEAGVELWPDVADLVAVALAYDPDAATGDHVLQQLVEGYARMLVTADGEELIGVTVVQLYKQRGQRLVHVLATTGDRMREWIDDLTNALAAMAVAEDCTAVTMVGRPGWAKRLTHYGFRTEFVKMRLEVADHVIRKGQTAAAADLGGAGPDVCGPEAGAVPGHHQAGRS